MLVAAFTDELSSGVVPASAPELLQTFSLTPAMAAGWTLFAYAILGVLIEPWLLTHAQGRRARPMMLLGLVGMGASCLLAAISPSYELLLIALLVYGPASGLGVGLAQAALMGARPGDREAMLARWTFYGGAGDLLAPLALAGSVALGLGWRG